MAIKPLESIFVSYSLASAATRIGPEFSYHAILNYIDKDGNHYVLDATPAERFERTIPKVGAFAIEELFSTGRHNTDSLFGRIQVRDERGTDRHLALPFEMIKTGEDLSDYWRGLQAHGKEVGDLGFEYRPKTQNSNTFVFSGLRRVNLPLPTGQARDPTSRELGNYPVYGGQLLRNPINRPKQPHPFFEDDPPESGTVSDIMGAP